ncbi:uncharacterized protein LOC128986893 [Macrosteles quadrilineatus]|uniref:uncharacterized protein LOC128986893 n=1 Tax=Macrosteles quadrilineatus TaxID=74068 RepID=UPI0023E2744F|nr:uncharacterized protein LOC128986893 [Macrosteles quadrilineatus]
MSATVPDMATSAGYNDETACFILNGELHSLTSVPVETSLNTYIRQYARLKGTKFMCREGGCGVCVVSLHYIHPATGEEMTVSVNSCMFPVYACHGMEVTTVEGIGSRQKGYNEIQTRLAHFYGTQCGYCTPGWVMSMYSFLQSNPTATMNEIEDSFSGNLCRCTGYRPILDAFKSFASDKTQELEQKVLDIEDLLKTHKKKFVQRQESEKARLCKPVNISQRKKGTKQNSLITSEKKSQPKLKIMNPSGRGLWYKVVEVEEIFEIFDMLNGREYMLVGGNTAQGIMKDQPSPDVFIDVSSVAFLKAHSFYSGSWYVGANTTLSDAITFFISVANENPKYFSYFQQVACHIEKVANTPVRNVGTLAGNLSIKHQWRTFQSDIFLILETVGALLSVRGERGTISVISMPEYLETNMYKKVILQIIFPSLDNTFYIYKSYKIAPRAQNALALTNAGFLFKIGKKNRHLVLGKPRVIFGNISAQFIHAAQLEDYLAGRSLLEPATLRGALDILEREVHPDLGPTEPHPEYRRKLTQACFYRFVLSVTPDAVSPHCRSGGEDISRPLSSGQQEFDTDSSRPPLYQPFPKLDSLLQCSGEAEYVFDIPTTGDEVYAALVITKLGPADLLGLDANEALKIPGVLAFYSAKDIPGENTFTPIDPFIPETEQLFTSKRSLYAGQPVGVIVAKTQELADHAAERVHILYGGIQKPLLDVRDVVRNKITSRITQTYEGKATKRKDDIKKVVKGDFKLETQYHFTMETMSCVVVPVEGELDVYCTSQWLAKVQETIALVLNMPENKINVKLRRVGGGYGQKLTRSNIVAGACGLAAHLLQRPVRIVTKLETVMEAIGKRWPCWFNYQVGVNDEGEIQYATTNVYNDAGSSSNDSVSEFVSPAIGSVYDSSTWTTMLYNVKTDKSTTAWTRGPGTLEAVTIAETIMEHVAHEIGRDPLDVRIANIDNKYPVLNLISQLKEKSDYESRKKGVQDFNKNNLWKKRGITLMPMRFPMETLGNYHAMVSVYRNDGSVAITHGGVEIGQGIDTKAAQVCASALGIPLDCVVVKPTNTLICPNNQVTGGSFTTESVCYAVEQCCIELMKRLEPVRAKLTNPTWQDTIKSAYEAGVNLNVSKMFSPTTDLKSYQIFGACVLEVELDILTGEHKCVRADILEDAGKSLNQYIDIGQIEGAFMMGLGYCTSEEVKYDHVTGRVLTNRTLTYKIPGAKDIPVDLRVYILKNGDNPLGILRSKTVGEPPICLAISVMFALRAALRSAHQDLGLPDVWLNIDAPFTAEHLVMSSGINAKNFSL